MLPTVFMRETVTVVRAGRTTGYGGNPRLDWDAATRREIGGCSVQPGTGDTDYEKRQGVMADLTVYIADPEADVTAADRIEVPGRAGTYLLMGEPQRWRTGLPLDHCVLVLQSWEG